MSMAALISNLFLLFFPCLFVPLLAKNANLLSCDNHEPHYSSGFCFCNHNSNNKSENQQQCSTFAVLITNPYYSSLSNLSSYLGLNRFAIAEANGFSAETEFLPINQPLLIPIDCKCSSAGVFQAEISYSAPSVESFDDIVESLHGLTTCSGIRDKNPGLSPWNVKENSKVSVPLRCGCPTSSELISSGTKLLVAYPASEGESLTSLAAQFNTTREAILRANDNKSETEIVSDSLAVLIPLTQKPLLGSLAKPREPSQHQKKKYKMKKFVICIVVISVAIAFIAISVAAFLIVQRKRQQQRQRQRCLSAKMGIVDVELQQLSLSIRTTSEKKVSFEGSQSTLDGQAMEPTTPRTCKIMLESYTLEEIKKATEEDFNSHNLIEGSVYHCRLKGKNVAIKSTTSDFLSKVDYSLFQDAIHNHPNIMRVLGSCVVTEGAGKSYLVFEYAKNGSLKDWIHGGLAMKSHFIASCSCFLTWRQRLRICLDVALALQYMHHIMHPVYVHRNIKSRNIFLDEEFNAKVGNFGMSRCVGDEKEEDLTDQFSSRNPASWTKGYLAPEFVKDGLISTGTDVFAYGVVLLEVLSGETPVTCSSDQKDQKTVVLSEKIKSVLLPEDADELRGWMDADLGDNYSFDGAVTLANLARSCTDDDPALRPSAGEIVEKLSRLVEESPEGDQQLLINESCSKPLVQAAASSNN